MIKVSVIIPTFNRCKLLLQTLKALSEQSLSPNDYEVIVAVDGSTDGTEQLLRDWKPAHAFRVIETSHRGAGAARNAGLRVAQGQLVLFLDDDLAAPPELLRLHCSAHSGSESQVVHGPIYVDPGSEKTIIRYITERFYEEYYRNLNPDAELRYPSKIGESILMLSSMVNSSMPREAALGCGGFDEEILGAEDLELGLRLWKMGLPLRFQPTAFVYESHVKSSENYLRTQAKAIGAGDLRASRKHPEYRPYSDMACFARTRTSSRWLRSVLTRSPVSLVPLLYLPLRFEKVFYGCTPLRNILVHLFRIAERIARLRGALDAAGSWKALESEFDRRMPVLLYHHVGPWRPGTYRSLTVSPKKFERQMRWLARRGYVGIKSSEWNHWQTEGAAIPKKPIIITFDDAYADIADYALPIMRRYGLNAIVFVVTQRLGGTNTWDEVEGCGTLPLMATEQISYWADRGIEFGAHSRTHPDLTKLSVAECVEEIAGGKNDLASLLRSPITSFAYPYGRYNQTSYELASANFDLAFGVEEGLNFLKEDPHLLKRIYIGPTDSLLEFALCVQRGDIRTIRNWRIKLAFRTRLKNALRSLSRMMTRK